MRTRAVSQATARSPANGTCVIGTATDEALARRAAGGQREAFEELVRRHRGRVYALALRICRNPDDAEDALQETFIAAYRALPRFDSRARVSTWLYRIATNKCYDVLARRRPTADAAALPEPADPARPVRAQPAGELLTRALDALPRAVPRGGAPVRRLRPHAGRGRRGRRRPGGHHEVAQLPRARRCSRWRCARAARNRRREAGSNGRGRQRHSTTRVPEAELEAVRRALAGLGEEPLPADVATRLDARLAAELDSLAARGTPGAPPAACAWAPSLSAAAAVAAIAVFALSWGGGGHTPPGHGRARSRRGAASAAATRRPRRATPPPRPRRRRLPRPPRRSPAAPASRTGGDRPRAGCPGARGGHARAV